MCIRSVAVDDGSGPVLQGDIDQGDWGRRGQPFAVFNPKGGVGKTMIATNLAAMLADKGQRVLLLDADTVTGHVTTSLGMDGVPTVVDAWRDEIDGGPVLTFDEMASVHPSGLQGPAADVQPDARPSSSSRSASRGRSPSRVATSTTSSSTLHPSYSPLNRAMFDKADRILVPVTPDLPAIRALVKLRDVADELGMRRAALAGRQPGRLGHRGRGHREVREPPCYAEIRSAGMLLVKANNEGRTLLEIGPRERITQDFQQLAARILGIEMVEAAAKPQLRFFGRQVSARA